ncbi:hypothetical protein HYU20_02370 [Candidatus Woesearchaeota archaeon]|nr:hypothetical protein [Candidatus Woesearchaeota archaeon]
MKISIDTKEDSPEEIRKLIRMLLALVGESSGYGERTPPATGEGLFDMFGDPQASTSEQQQLGKGGSGSSGGMDINEFIDNADESSSQKPGSDDEDVRVVPY